MKFFILGLGSIGLRHAKNLMSLGHKVAGYDTDETAMLKAQNAGVVFTHVDKGAEAADAWLICTPTAQHIGGLHAAVLANKHAFVEKPIAEHANGELVDYLDMARKKSLVVMVGNMLRFHSEVRDVRRYIKKPERAIFWVRQKNSRYTEDVILNWGAHEIDLALHLLGPAKVTKTLGNKEQAAVYLLHNSGAESIVHMDYLTEPEVRKFEIDLEDATTVEADLRLPDWNDVYMDEMREFIIRVDNSRIGPGYSQFMVGATGDDGLATLKLINDAQRMMNARD